MNEHIEKIENRSIQLFRCGYCGRFYAGIDYVDCNLFSEKEQLEAPFGYCPNAQQEHYEQNPPQNEE